MSREEVIAKLSEGEIKNDIAKQTSTDKIKDKDWLQRLSVEKNEHRLRYTELLQKNAGELKERDIKGRFGDRRNNENPLGENARRSQKEQRLNVKDIPDDLLTESLKTLRDKTENKLGASRVYFSLAGKEFPKNAQEVTNVETGEITIVIDNLVNSPECAMKHGLTHIWKVKYPELYKRIEDITRIVYDAILAKGENSQELSRFDKLVLDRVEVARANEENYIEELACDLFSGCINENKNGYNNRYFLTNEGKLQEEYTADDDYFYDVDQYSDEQIKIKDGRYITEIFDEIYSIIEDDTDYIIKKYAYSFDKNSLGDRLSYGQKDFFRKSKVRDYLNKTRNLYVTFNCSNADFDSFDMSKSGKGAGSIFGWGMYFAKNEELALSFGSKPKKYYLDIQKPLFETKLTMAYNEFDKLTKAISKRYGIDILDKLFNKERTNNHAREETFMAFALVDKKYSSIKELYDDASNDLNLIKSLEYAVYNSVKDVNIEEFLDIVYRETGNDGIICYRGSGEGTQFVVFKSEKIKSIYNLYPKDNSRSVYFSKTSAISKSDTNLKSNNNNDFRISTKSNKNANYLPNSLENSGKNLSNIFDTSCLSGFSFHAQAIPNDPEYDYMVKKHNMRGSIVKMSPKEYLTEQAKNFDKNYLEYVNQFIREEKDYLIDLANKIDKGLKLPMPFTNRVSKDQDGVHRMIAIGMKYGFQPMFLFW